MEAKEKLSDVSLDELRKRLQAIQAEIERREQEEREKGLEQIKAIAEKIGLDLSQLSGKKQGKKKVEAKYKGPNGELWTGRGRAPKWMQGKDPEQFRIK